MVTRLRVLGAIAAGLFALVAAGCSDTPPVTEVDDAEPSAIDEQPEPEPEPEAEPEPEPEPEPDPEPEPEEVAPDEAAMAYFEAFASGRPSEMTRMVDYAAEGSAAWVYAQVQSAFAATQQQEGWSIEPQRLRVTPRGIELCQTDFDGRQHCMDFDDLAVTDGKLASFTVGGETLEDRLFEGGVTVSDGGVTVELLGAYHSVQADSLIVTVDITNDSSGSVSLSLYSSEYVTPDNRQVAAANVFGPFELRAGASSYATMGFPAQGVGGTVYVTGWPDNSSTELEWELPLKPLDDST